MKTNLHKKLTINYNDSDKMQMGYKSRNVLKTSRNVKDMAIYTPQLTDVAIDAARPLIPVGKISVNINHDTMINKMYN